ncbi:MAG TPA: phosphatase PAP2 family protein [Ignavibacteria bacterium]|nr:phosphatase PAP2 family protein [Ignavibacteria bacterium]
MNKIISFYKKVSKIVHYNFSIAYCILYKKQRFISKHKIHIAILIFLFAFIISDCPAQRPYRTIHDTTKYNEKNIDIKIFRFFNNINSSFVNSLVNVTNRSIIPVSIGTPVIMYAASRINENSYDESSSILLALSEVTNGLVTHGLKYAVKRKRPFKTLNNVQLNDTNYEKDTYSFPSGHSSASFAIATSLTLRYPDDPVLITGLFTYATIVSLGRIYWGVHYPSDVFAGMLIGAGSAALIYSLRAPIIKSKNDLFNQSERTDSFQGKINSPLLLMSLAAADFINFYFSRSDSRLLKNSSLNFNVTGKINYLNYNLSF